MAVVLWLIKQHLFLLGKAAHLKLVFATMVCLAEVSRSLLALSEAQGLALSTVRRLRMVQVSSLFRQMPFLLDNPVFRRVEFAITAA
jgi:hypothetical protein